MATFRSFRNYDPPELLRLWSTCGLGRGAAQGIGYDAFDLLVYSQPHFDPQGLIVAEEGDRLVGFTHAGFGPAAVPLHLDYSVGIISLVMVAPQARRQGIGRELVARAEEYLRRRNASVIQGGESPTRNPFYQGLYGGSQISGFLASDPAAAPFIERLGYSPAEQFSVMQKDLTQKNEPVDFRLANLRRLMQLVPSEAPPSLDPWWVSHIGHFDPVLFLLQPKAGGPPVARVTCHGLDLYAQSWGRRAVGFSELLVPENQRRKGFGKVLLLEILRRIRDETVTIAELHAPLDNPAAMNLLTWLRFQEVDQGTVYRKA